jgi:hypothetical protein
MNDLQIYNLFLISLQYGFLRDLLPVQKSP